MNSIATVVVVVLGLHIITKFAFFVLPYRRRRALLDKQYGDKPSATTTSDLVLMAFTVVIAALLLWRGVDAVSFLGGFGSVRRSSSCISTNSTVRCRRTAPLHHKPHRSKKCRTQSKTRRGGPGPTADADRVGRVQPRSADLKALPYSVFQQRPGERIVAAQYNRLPSEWENLANAGGGSGRAGVPYRVFVRWIVDGMNVIGSRPDGWWKDRGRAMVALVDKLDQWASGQGDDVTVVFERPPSTAITASVIEVAYAPKAAANSADDEIVRLVQADTRPQDIRVVTSDKALSDRVASLGASVYPAAGFRDLIDPRGQ